MTPRRVLLVSANREVLPSPVMPLGVLYIAAALRDHGHLVRISDLCFEERPYDSLRRDLAAFGADVVGIGLRNLHANDYAPNGALLEYYRDLVETTREATSAPIVLGGAAFSLQPETLLHTLGGDYGVAGEGEVTMPRLVDALASGGQAERISRSTVLRELGHQSPGAAGTLDGLPAPARDLVDPRYVQGDGTANVQTKRGCVFACTYCHYPDLEGRRVRVRSRAAVADEVAACARTPGVSHLFFVDSVFNAPRWHALAVCEELVNRGSSLPWVCYASPAALDDRLLDAMARAGCVGIEIGSDAGTDRLLARLRKPFVLADIEAAHERIRARGLSDCHTFVLGALDETPEETRRTLEFVDRLDPDVAVFVVFVEDREARGPHRASHREEILGLLANEAPRHPGWSVPELGIRFGEKVTRYAKRLGLRGPTWLHLAHARRARFDGAFHGAE
ncbi:MAG: B12-binding domain-containing radical SAM protein [Gemmatimonadales bacterium]